MSVNIKTEKETWKKALNSMKLPLHEYVTHYGNDIDNRLARMALVKAGILTKKAKAIRRPAGVVEEGKLNLDIGNELCTSGITFNSLDKTLIVDHHFNAYKNTLEILDMVGVYVPRSAVELADTEESYNPTDPYCMVFLVRSISDKKLWELAEKGLLGKTMSEEELQEHGLWKAAQYQKKIITNAIKELNRGTVYENALIVESYIPSGSTIAYHMGYEIYCSVQEHKEGGVSFAITSIPGKSLNSGIIGFGRRLQEQYGEGIFVSRNNNMIIAGGPRNPRFSVPLTIEEFKQSFYEAMAEDAGFKKTQEVMT